MSRFWLCPRGHCRMCRYGWSWRGLGESCACRRRRRQSGRRMRLTCSMRCRDGWRLRLGRLFRRRCLSHCWLFVQWRVRRFWWSSLRAGWRCLCLGELALGTLMGAKLGEICWKLISYLWTCRIWNPLWLEDLLLDEYSECFFFKEFLCFSV